jgi:hypothetical protein
MKACILALLSLSACGPGDGPSVSVSQTQHNDSDNGNTKCTRERSPQLVDGVVICAETLTCDGAVVRGPDFVAVPLSECQNAVTGGASTTTATALSSSSTTTLRSDGVGGGVTGQATQ